MVCISSGKFSIKSTWEAIKLVSESFMIPRHSFISWLAVFDRLATRQRQLRWGRSSDDKFLFCNSSSECRDHFFFLALLRWVYGRVFSIVQKTGGRLAVGVSVGRIKFGKEILQVCIILRSASYSYIYHLWAGRKKWKNPQKFLQYKLILLIDLLWCQECYQFTLRR